MKKKFTRTISVILCIVLLVCSMSLGVSAAEPQGKGYTFVFVHGLCGWGSDDGANKYFPYWGMMTGNLFTELERNGYSCVAAGVGTVSSGALKRKVKYFSSGRSGRTIYCRMNCSLKRRNSMLSGKKRVKATV